MAKLTLIAKEKLSAIDDIYKCEQCKAELKSLYNIAHHKC